MRCICTKPGETWTLGGAAVKLDPVLVVNDLEMACDAAIAGVGVAQVPAIVCREAVANGRLVVLFPRDAPILKPVYVVFPSRRHLSVKVRLFIDALARLVEPMTPLGVQGMRAL
jgi:DNA-binding transcriptional LysR family regulator